MLKYGIRKRRLKLFKQIFPNPDAGSYDEMDARQSRQQAEEKEKENLLK